MDKRKSKTYRDKLLVRREGLVGQVQAAEAYSRERDAEATQDPADMAANAYTKELMMSMSTNDRQLLESIDAALHRIAVTQIRLDGLGQAYYRHRPAIGDSSTEALRCLTRRLSRVVFHHLHTDHENRRKPCQPAAA